jgi:hypothetical protein
LVFSLRYLSILGMEEEPQYQSPPPPYFKRAMVKAEGFWFKVAFWVCATDSDPKIKNTKTRISFFIRINIIQSRVGGCLQTGNLLNLICKKPLQGEQFSDCFNLVVSGLGPDTTRNKNRLGFSRRLEDVLIKFILFESLGGTVLPFHHDGTGHEPGRIRSYDYPHQ